MSLEQFCAFAGVSMRLDPSQLAVALGKLNRPNPELRKRIRYVRPGFRDQLIRKKIAVPVNDSQARLLVGGAFHIVAMMLKSMALRHTQIEQSWPGQKQEIFAAAPDWAILASLLAVFERRPALTLWDVKPLRFALKWVEHSAFLAETCGNAGALQETVVYHPGRNRSVPFGGYPGGAILWRRAEISGPHNGEMGPSARSSVAASSGAGGFGHSGVRNQRRAGVA
jgi:hypothetical protein